jgi:hypothetical protein
LSTIPEGDSGPSTASKREIEEDAGPPEGDPEGEESVGENENEDNAAWDESLGMIDQTNHNKRQRGKADMEGDSDK